MGQRGSRVLARLPPAGDQNRIDPMRPVQVELVRLHREGVLHAEFVNALTSSIGSMRGQANDLMSSLDRDKPYSYASLCGLLVQINLLIMSTWKGVDWATWLHSFGDQLICQPKFWADILVLFSWNLSYKGLYDLAYTLHNPFGDRRLDVAHETIGGGIRRLAEEIAAVTNRLPPSLAQLEGSSSAAALRQPPGAYPLGGERPDDDEVTCRT